MPRAVILGGARTPFVKAGTAFAELDVLDLGRSATAEALARSEIDPGQVDEVIFGNVARPVAYHNLAREVVLSLSMPARVPAFTVGLACASACVAVMPCGFLSSAQTRPATSAAIASPSSSTAAK